MPPPLPKRNEVHVCLAPNGHISSTDCWCEPSTIRWITNKFGVKILVIEHDDQEPITMHHSGVIYARDRTQDWITVFLDTLDSTVTDDPNKKELP
jgi:hypothetical protein